MAEPEQEATRSIQAGLTPEGEAMLSSLVEPHTMMLAGLGLIAYVIGRWVIGPRDPKKPRRWWDYRRID